MHLLDGIELGMAPGLTGALIKEDGRFDIGGLVHAFTKPSWQRKRVRNVSLDWREMNRCLAIHLLC